jgi:hypothetical protein
MKKRSIVPYLEGDVGLALLVGSTIENSSPTLDVTVSKQRMHESANVLKRFLSSKTFF